MCAYTKKNDRGSSIFDDNLFLDIIEELSNEKGINEICSKESSEQREESFFNFDTTEDCLIRMNLQLLSEEKTEEPTQRKLQKAREKGQISKSKDVIDNSIILVAVVSLRMLFPYMKDQFDEVFRNIFSNASLLEINMRNFMIVFQMVIIGFLKITIPILCIWMIVGIAINYAQTGFIYTTEPMKFKFSKLNPITGLKRIFSKRSLFELFKFLLKFAIIICFMIIDYTDKLVTINTLAFFGLKSASTLMFEEMYNYLLKIILVLFAMSFIDFYFQKKFFIKEMKMSKKEIKDEYKQTEGDPLIKGKIKERQRSISMNTLIKEAKEATIVVANPTHIAVCIKYEKGMFAPVVTAMARDHVAQKIKSIAKENYVPVVENKPLARGLYNDAEIGKPIPTEYFRAVAEVIVAVLSIKK